MEDNNLKNQFSADLLSVVSKVLGEAEQIDELKTSTLKSYRSKAREDKGDAEDEREFYKAHNDQKGVKHQTKRRNKRVDGINMANDKMNGGARSTVKIRSVGEEVSLDEKHGGADYALYHKSYTDAVDHALSHHGKDGLTVSDNDKFHHIGIMSKKPSEGNTTTLNLPAKHNMSGKNHRIHIQVYNKGGTHPYELNTYSSKNSVRDDKREASFDEEVELDEARPVNNPEYDKSEKAWKDRKAKWEASQKKTTKEEVELEEKRGLWDNIHAKRKRIKAGSGERMRKPGSEGAPTDTALKLSKEEVELDEKLIGKQTEIDADKDGKIEKSDFMKLRNKKIAAKMKSKSKEKDDEDCECKEETNLDEAKQSSLITGTRLVSTHKGADGHHAEVRYNKDYEEYQTHHYMNGKHMGEGPVSYHGSGKEGREEATIAAKTPLSKNKKD